MFARNSITSVWTRATVYFLECLVTLYLGIEFASKWPWELDVKKVWETVKKANQLHSNRYINLIP